MFDSVYNLQCPVGQPFSHVARPGPPILVKQFCRLFGVLEISLGHVGPLVAHLPLPVGGIIVHFWNVFELYAATWHDCPNMTDIKIEWKRESDTSSAFCLSVSLVDL